MLLLIWNKCSCNSFEEYCEIDHAAFHKTAMLSYFAELSFKVHMQSSYVRSSEVLHETLIYQWHIPIISMQYDKVHWYKTARSLDNFTFNVQLAITLVTFNESII